MILLSQLVDRKPIIPVLVKDQNTALLILLTLGIISLFILYRTMRYYDG